MAAASAGCALSVREFAPGVMMRGDRHLLLAALGNLLQNACKFTHAGTLVTLEVTTSPTQIQIDVADHCGGLPHGTAEELFKPFHQRSGDTSGLGLGLTIAERSIEASAGTLSVQDDPGVGCVFSMRLPRDSG